MTTRWPTGAGGALTGAAAATYRPSRRQLLTGGGALLLAGLAGCGGAAETTGSGRSIKHKYGSTRVSGSPKRVVTVGLTEQDPVLALGVRPVGIVDWYGDYPNAVWPWGQQALGDAKPKVLSVEELDFEQIALLNPDLITGVSSGLAERDYRRLSEIAPTVAQSGEYQDYGTPWQEQTRTLGRALGRQARADELVGKLEQDFASAREQHPEFEGKSAVVAAASSNGASYLPYVYSPEDVRSRFLTALGFQIPDEIAKLAGDTFSVELSRERLDLLERDAVVWISLAEGALDTVREDAIYQKLSIARQGRDVFLTDEELNGALSFGTVLSLRFALEKLVPQLADAVDGQKSSG